MAAENQGLADNTSPWVVCTFHHPIFSTGKDRDNPELRGLWKPVFDKHHVDLVLQGHDHTYGRTGLQTPPATPVTIANVPTAVNAVALETGTIYVVSVSGPKMYNLNRKPFMPRAAEDTQLYQIIHVGRRHAALRSAYRDRLGVRQLHSQEASRPDQRADGRSANDAGAAANERACAGQIGRVIHWAEANSSRGPERVCARSGPVSFAPDRKTGGRQKKRSR